MAITSREKDADIVPVLLESIQNHEICTFDTVASRYIFGKPSKWAMDFYKPPLISENSDGIQEEGFLDYFDDDEGNEEKTTDEDNLSDVDLEELFNDDF